jgi:hypothetical protein
MTEASKQTQLETTAVQEGEKPSEWRAVMLAADDERRAASKNYLVRGRFRTLSRVLLFLMVVELIILVFRFSPWWR